MPLLPPALALAPALVLAQVTTEMNLPEGMVGVPLEANLSQLLGLGWEVKGFAVDQGNQNFVLQNGKQTVLCSARIDTLSGEGGSSCALISPPGLK